MAHQQLLFHHGPPPGGRLRQLPNAESRDRLREPRTPANRVTGLKGLKFSVQGALPGVRVLPLQVPDIPQDAWCRASLRKCPPAFVTPDTSEAPDCRDWLGS